MLSSDGERRGPNKSEREEEGRSRGFVGADRDSWVDTALTRASRRLQKNATAAPLALPGQGEGPESEDREKRCGSERLQKDQKQNHEQKCADDAVNDAELAARRGSRLILERDNPPVKSEMKAQHHQH